jgi:hypothetical protein
MANTESAARASFLRRWLAPVPESRVAAQSASVHTDVQFEGTDVNGRRVVLAGLGLLVVVWIIVVLLHFVFAAFARYRAEISPPPLPLASQQNRLPPAPQLQVSPEVDLKELRAYEDSKLNNYTWVDRQKGVVEIPIDRAMQILAARGIPAQKAPADLNLAAPTAGTRMTGFEGKVEPEP